MFVISRSGNHFFLFHSVWRLWKFTRASNPNGSSTRAVHLPPSPRLFRFSEVGQETCTRLSSKLSTKTILLVFRGVLSEKGWSKSNRFFFFPFLLSSEVGSCGHPLNFSTRVLLKVIAVSSKFIVCSRLFLPLWRSRDWSNYGVNSR